jgi:hypothetical protein
MTFCISSFLYPVGIYWARAGRTDFNFQYLATLLEGFAISEAQAVLEFIKPASIPSGSLHALSYRESCG